MRLRWEKDALADLQRLRSAIAVENRQAAQRVMDRILGSVRILEHFPSAGLSTPHPRLRRWIEPSYGYVIIYEVRAEEGVVRLLSVFHPRQNRP